jgi:hypothetical protein
MSSSAGLRGTRVLRPRQTWHVLDFVLAAVAACCLAYALWGAATALAALEQLRELGVACAHGACTHHGMVRAHSVVVGSANRYGGPGGGVNYCAMTMDLDVGTRKAAVISSTCNGLNDGQSVDAEIWRGNVVTVTTPAGTIGTFLHPSVGLFLGLWRMLALVPFLALVAMIHTDVVNHRAWRVFRRVARA